jgi:hypothetical protein
MIINDRVKQQFLHIADIVKTIGEPIEGNFICNQYDDPTNFQLERNEHKIKNIQFFAYAKSRICEIGINACHSLLLMLDINPTAEYILFDINHHKYTEPCLDYVRSLYPNTKIITIFGDSKKTLLESLCSNSSYLSSVDFCHIDGGHSIQEVISDYAFIRLFMKRHGKILFDDYNLPWIKTFLDSRVDNHEIEYLPIYPTGLHIAYHHIH